MTDDHDRPMQEYRRAGLEISRGNPAVYKSLWSRRDDVTVADPFGAPVRGWQQVSDRLELAARNYRDGRDYEFENIATVIAAELAYTVETNASGRACADPTSAVRSPSGRRPSFGASAANWKVTHRHGDPLTSMRPAESVLQS